MQGASTWRRTAALREGKTTPGYKHRQGLLTSYVGHCTTPDSHRPVCQRTQENHNWGIGIWVLQRADQHYEYSVSNTLLTITIKMAFCG